jgi:hypothetical protein
VNHKGIHMCIFDEDHFFENGVLNIDAVLRRCKGFNTGGPDFELSDLILLTTSKDKVAESARDNCILVKNFIPC